jgi:hypothetical protein
MLAIGYKSRIVSCSASLPLNESATRFPGPGPQNKRRFGGRPALITKLNKSDENFNRLRGIPARIIALDKR